MIAGIPTMDHWRVGRIFRVLRAPTDVDPHLVGQCVSVTPWGGGRIRWVRLRFADGTEKSYSPGELREEEPLP